jgi:hypothetical protein
LLISQLLPLTSFLFAEHELTLQSPPQELESLFQKEHDLYSPNNRSFFRLYSVTPSPNSTVLSFCYEYPLGNISHSSLTPNDRPQYRTMLEYRSRFSTTVIGDLTRAMELHVQNLDQMANRTPPPPPYGVNVERLVSPSKYAWEGKVLYDAGTLEQRIQFITLLRKKFEPIQCEHETSPQ